MRSAKIIWVLCFKMSRSLERLIDFYPLSAWNLHSLYLHKLNQWLQPLRNSEMQFQTLHNMWDVQRLKRLGICEKRRLCKNCWYILAEIPHYIVLYLFHSLLIKILAVFMGFLLPSVKNILEAKNAKTNLEEICACRKIKWIYFLLFFGSALLKDFDFKRLFWRITRIAKDNCDEFKTFKYRN